MPGLPQSGGGTGWPGGQGTCGRFSTVRDGWHGWHGQSFGQGWEGGRQGILSRCILPGLGTEQELKDRRGNRGITHAGVGAIPSRSCPAAAVGSGGAEGPHAEVGRSRETPRWPTNRFSTFSTFTLWHAIKSVSFAPPHTHDAPHPHPHPPRGPEGTCSEPNTIKVNHPGNRLCLVSVAALFTYQRLGSARR
jgi:hypothetical protein